VNAARRIGAVSLVVAPLFGLIGGALHPERETDPAELLAVVAAKLDPLVPRARVVLRGLAAAARGAAAC
jgi:hypothetical protein